MSFSKNVPSHMVIVAFIYLTLTCTTEKYPITIYVAFVSATVFKTTRSLYYTNGAIMLDNMWHWIVLAIRAGVLFK